MKSFDAKIVMQRSLCEDRDVKIVVCWSVADDGKVSEKKKKSVMRKLFGYGPSSDYQGNFYYGKWIKYELKTI